MVTCFVQSCVIFEYPQSKENFFLVLILGTKSKYMQVEKFSLIPDTRIKTNISEFSQCWCFL